MPTSAWCPVPGRRPQPTGAYRTAPRALRIINDIPDATRVEFRVPSADTNPYLALAMCLGAGLWGIRNKVEPPPGSSANLYAVVPEPKNIFPTDLGRAAEKFAASPEARETFGDVFVDAFVAARRFEDAEYRRHVSPWELRRYLEVV